MEEILMQNIQPQIQILRRRMLLQVYQFHWWILCLLEIS
jgi:hypothetical protein